jgi:hypothetical protein
LYTKDLNAVYHQNINLPVSPQSCNPDGATTASIFFNNAVDLRQISLSTGSTVRLVRWNNARSPNLGGQSGTSRT